MHFRAIVKNIAMLTALVAPIGDMPLQSKTLPHIAFSFRIDDAVMR
jgi:hypothetical protein